MREVVETRSVKLNIPVFVEDYYAAYQGGDQEECNELRERFYRAYDNVKPEARIGLRAYLQSYLDKTRIDDKKDLGGVFQSLKIFLN